ncbi:hypothetical protein V1264_016807 [Littorina saxatilis]|uniref:Uncharacterized protein n=1 Tax=Littorina saxatilis TaxID=31220 RepID=A0AAN9BH53_9CAEN
MRQAHTYTSMSKPSMITLLDLQILTTQNTFDRVGATNDPERRFGEYKQDEKYERHMMFYAMVDNQKKEENILLSCGGNGLKYNEQRQSNAPEEPGCVYGMKPISDLEHLMYAAKGICM